MPGFFIVIIIVVCLVVGDAVT